MKTHPLNVSYLVVGLVFVGIAATWGLHEAGVIDTGSVDWLLPLTLVVAGGVGLAAFAVKALRRRGTDADQDRTPYGVEGQEGEEARADEPTLSHDPTIDIQRELDRTDQGENR